jgi:hypothetical protein
MRPRCDDDIPDMALSCCSVSSLVTLCCLSILAKSFLLSAVIVASICDNIKKVTKPISGESVYCPDDEFFVDGTLAMFPPVNLAVRYSHGLSHFDQARVVLVVELKNPWFSALLFRDLALLGR